MTPYTRYHPVLITLHWILAVLITASLASGWAILDRTPDADPARIAVLRTHMAGGMLILALMAIRLAIRWRTSTVRRGTPGAGAFHRIPSLVHDAAYALVPSMAVTGVWTAKLTGLSEIVFGGSGAPIPEGIDVVGPAVAHATLAAVFGALILLHVIAVAYRQLVAGEKPMHRMTYGRAPSRALTTDAKGGR